MVDGKVINKSIISENTTKIKVYFFNPYVVIFLTYVIFYNIKVI